MGRCPHDNPGPPFAPCPLCHSEWQRETDRADDIAARRIIAIPPGHRVVRATLVLSDLKAAVGSQTVATWGFDVAVPVVMSAGEIERELERRLALPRIEAK